jgi:ketosteroid isomerase-like protein
MSTNMDLVRSIFATWEAGDFSSHEWAHQQIEFSFADGPSPGSWTGVAAMAEGMRDFLSAWNEFTAAADEYRELDEGRVLVLFHATGRAKTSGVHIEQMQDRGAALFCVRGGKVRRLVTYYDRSRAFTALGIGREADAGRPSF